jgi:phage terminase Nu1 subunit (DNA packaging protein)
VTLTVDRLRELIRECIEEARSSDELLTQEEIAQKLKVSTHTVRERREAGMPVVRVGRLLRYDDHACREWLVTRSRPTPAESEEGYRPHAA